MSRGRHRAAIVPAVIVAAVLAACGGDGTASTSDYEQQLRETMQELEQAYGSATAAVIERNADDAATSVGDVVAQLRASQVALRDAGRRLDDVEPPPHLARQHGRLVSGVRDMADAIDLLVQAQRLAATRPRRAERLARRFAADDSFRRVEAAAAALSTAGVDADL